MTELTIPQIEEIAARAAEATPGPWVCQYRGDGSGSVYEGLQDDDEDKLALIDDARCPFMRGEVRYEDGVFAAAARADVPALCATALSAIRERERLKNLLAIALHKQDSWIKTAHLKVNELIEVRAERDAMRAAIKDAPCDRGCWGGTIAAGGTDEKPNRHPHLPKCWKSRIGVKP